MKPAKQPTAWPQEKTEHLKYVRGPAQTKQFRRRSALRQRELKAAAQNTRSFLQMRFSSSSPALTSTSTTTSSNKPESTPTKNLAQATAIKDLGKKLQAGIRKEVLVGQNLARHQAVLGFLKTQISRQGETHDQMALYVARSHGGGLYFARKIISWGRSWMLSGWETEEGRK